MVSAVPPQERLAILCVSSEWDRLYAAFSHSLCPTCLDKHYPDTDNEP